VGVSLARPDLVAEAIDGDVAAFARMLEPLWDPAYRLAFAMLGDRGAAEDAVQDAALNAWRGVRRLRPSTTSLRPWFLTIVANQCRSTRRAPWWRVIRLPNLPDRLGRSGAREDDRLDLESALRTLNDQQRLVLVLHYYLDLPIDEVAATIGVSRSAAKSRVIRAVKALRPALQGPEVSK
jgi:RNA polymerase sigma-70 factor (ECF subfamily)